MASWAIDGLLALEPRGIPRLHEVTLDGRVLAFTLVVSVLVGVAFGLFPAVTVSSQDPADWFRGEGRGSGSRQRSRFRAGLVVTQISLALVLLAGAALLIVSVRRLAGVDPGFRAEGAVTFQFTIPSAKYTDADAQRGFAAQVLDRLKAIPGVEEAGAVFFLPLGESNTQGDVSVEGDAPAEPGREKYADYRIVAGRYLEAMAIALRRGRSLGPQDVRGAAPVALVSESFVRRFFGGADPIGKRITFGQPNDNPEWREVVGVVADVRQTGLQKDPPPELYVPAAQLSAKDWSIFAMLPMSFVLRSSLAVASLTPEIKAAVHDVDPEQPLSRIRPAKDLVSDAVARHRFSMLLLTLFGGLALTLSAIGVYGVMAYSVSQRTRELGIRLALGARAYSVQAMVLGQGLAMALVGIGLGLAGALALTRLLTTQLFEVSPSDPGVLAGAALLLASVSAVACLVPAIRATRVDPIEALRSE
jgi:putative ABC transport system permease protein